MDKTKNVITVNKPNISLVMETNIEDKQVANEFSKCVKNIVTLLSEAVKDGYYAEFSQTFATFSSDFTKKCIKTVIESEAI